ncbi:ATP-binding cassette domain-containing protein [Salana multivorans]
MDAERAVALEDVGFEYGRGLDTVVDGATFDVRYGVATCLFGPSGSGKSTLLALIGRLVQPTRGRVTWHPRHEAETAPRFAWVTQAANLVPSLTVVENVALGPLARSGSVAGSYARAEAAIAAVGLLGLERRPVTAVSGGQMQRVAIARALASDADVLLADEPTANLDASAAGVVLEAIGLAVEAGAAVVVASHDAAVLELASSRIEVRGGSCRVVG